MPLAMIFESDGGSDFIPELPSYGLVKSDSTGSRPILGGNAPTVPLHFDQRIPVIRAAGIGKNLRETWIEISDPGIIASPDFHFPPLSLQIPTQSPVRPRAGLTVQSR